MIGPGSWVRATDQDGSSSSEVSAGNFTFVETGTSNSASGWVVTGEGELTLNVDPIVWVQFSEGSSYTAGIGLTLAGNEFRLDVNNLTETAIAPADSIAFYDADGSISANKRTMTDVFTDLDIPNSITGNGFVVQTSAGVWNSREIAVEGAGTLNGLSITNADGTAGNPTLGLDIENLPATAAVDITDRIAVWDQSTSTNVYYTVSELSGAVAGTDSFSTWAFTGNVSGDASIVAESSADTANIVAGRGIGLNASSATDTVTYNFGIGGLANTVITTTDSIPFFDNSNSNIAEYRTISSMLADLAIVHDLGGNGIAVQTSAGNYINRVINGSVAVGLEGIDVVNGNGVSGDMTVGLDINGLAAAGTDLSATDRIAMNDGTNNVTKTGQEVADGVSSILGLGGFEISTINGQSVATILDATRASKRLSTDSVTLMFSENRVTHLDWLNIGSATDADSGYIAPMNGTIVYSTGHCEDTGSNSKDLHVFINTTDQGSVGSLSGGDNATYSNTTLNFDFVQGDRIRVQAVGAASGRIDDTVVSVYIKWRA